MNNRICAIIVTWNSGDEVKRSLPAIASQVGEVVVIDNGSTPENIKSLKALAAKFNNAIVIENGRNFGIAAAFNRGAEYAEKNSCEWFMTLDDNGKLLDGSVKTMLAAYAALSPELQEKTAIVAPNCTNLKGLVHRRGESRFVQTTVSTGQMIKTIAWRKIGGFKEELFITGVDHEFCFRMLKYGYKTLLVPDATLEATAGPKPEMKSLLGRKFVVPNYRPERYYYLYRNNVYIYKTYWRYAPGWILRNIGSDFTNYAKILFFEEQKMKKTAMIVRGVVNGIKNKLGQLAN